MMHEELVRLKFLVGEQRIDWRAGYRATCERLGVPFEWFESMERRESAMARPDPYNLRDHL